MKTRIVPIASLTESEIDQMFVIMASYYAAVDAQTFRQDLKEKQKIILLLDPSGDIKGFSTILEKSTAIAGENIFAIYSGDTVLEKQYWGNGALAMAFGRYMISVKIRHPFKNVYWFLISKGYKTYLLMTNNFPQHFPRFEESTPQLYKKMMDQFYQDRFGGLYQPQTGLVKMPRATSAHLKDFVAEITEELRQHPRIAFFEKLNPAWKDGEELACIAEVSLVVPLKYVLKRIGKVFTGHGKRFAEVYRK